MGPLIQRSRSVLPAVTLTGAVVGGDQSWTGVGDMTFTAASVLKSGSTNGNTLLLAANDTTFLTLTTGTTDTMGLGAFTLSGNITIGDTLAINTGVADNDYFTIGADDTGVGIVEVLRAQGAADPYISMGGSQENKFYYSGAVTLGGDVTIGTSVIDDDSGVVDLVDMGVVSAADGVEQAYVWKIDGTELLRLTALSDGAGGIDTTAVKCGTYLNLHSTDTDSAVEGDVWYDASENKLKFHNGTAVETVTSGV